MAKTYQIGIIGAAHSHTRSLAKCAAQLPNAQIVAVADLDLARAKEIAEPLGVTDVYDDHSVLLEKHELDVVLCCSENSRHLAITRDATRAGCHVLVEKPMAATFEGAHDMLLAARQADVTLMVNWPSAWDASLRKLVQLVQDGAVGQVFCIRTRYGHRGPDSGMPPEERAKRWWYDEALGGGALLDFCCYGANVSRWSLGEPAVSVTGMAGRLVHDFGDVEDNAIILVRYPNAICSFEATWSQAAGDGGSGLSVFGSEGTLVPCKDGDKEGVTLHRSRDEIEFIPADDLPEGHGSGPEHLIRSLETGEPLCTPVTPELNLEVMAILEAGEKAANTGQTVTLPTLEL